MNRRAWRQLKAKAAYRRERSKRKPPSPEFPGFCLLGVACLGLYCTIFPNHAGAAGSLIGKGLARAVGQGAYLLWAMIAYRGLRLILHRENRRPWRYLFPDLLILAVTCAFLSGFGQIFLDLNPAGYLGRGAIQFFNQFFGRGGGLFVAFFALGGLLIWRAGARPGQVIHWLTDQLRHDWNEWRQAVAEERTKVKENLPKKPMPKVLPKTAPLPPVKTIQEPSPKTDLPAVPTINKPAKAAPPVPAREPVARTAAVTPAAETELEPVIPYVKPSLDLLTMGDRNPVQMKEEDLLTSAQHLEKTLAEFGVQGKVVEIHPGPIITRFDFTPAPGIKVQAVANLSNDIALAMKAMSVRIVAPIPGKSAVGIELPNPKRALVRLREVLETQDFQSNPSKVALGLGKDAEGNPVVGDLATMPHLLIAGSTGAGKSVCIHALVMSLLFRATPQELKLLMIDPKRLELPLYNGIPHLYDPNQNPDACRVITDAKEAAKALEGMVRVMDHRFKKFASVMARDINHYNEKMAEEGRPPESYIVIIIDELADMMAVAQKEVEGSIQRLTQMARAVGIHLVLATQRPSVDVITGVIKANLPSRIAFRVASQTDSRVILDSMGAESLLGQGDMLYLPPGAPKPSRLQCGLITSKELQAVTEFVKAQGSPSYERILNATASASSLGGSGSPEELDDLQQALMLVLERKRVSQDLLKAHFGSSARATDLLSQLEIKGFIEKPEGTNRWTIHFERINNYLSTVRNQVALMENPE